MKLPFEVPPTWRNDGCDLRDDAFTSAPTYGRHGPVEYFPLWHWFVTFGRARDGHGCAAYNYETGTGYGSASGTGYSQPNDSPEHE